MWWVSAVRVTCVIITMHNAHIRERHTTIQPLSMTCGGVAGLFGCTLTSILPFIVVWRQPNCKRTKTKLKQQRSWKVTNWLELTLKILERTRRKKILRKMRRKSSQINSLNEVQSSQDSFSQIFTVHKLSVVAANSISIGEWILCYHFCQIACSSLHLVGVPLLVCSGQGEWRIW